MNALCFQSGARRAQVLIHLGAPAPATFTPARPGSLYVLDPKASVDPVPRALATTASVELKLGFAPVLFGEWTPVAAN